MLLQSYVVFSVFCDCVVDRVSVLGDSEIDDAGVVDDCIAMVIVLWIQYETWSLEDCKVQ